MAQAKVLRRWGSRVVGLLVTAAGLYVVAPSLLTMFDSWPSLGDVRPVWFVVVGALETASFVSLWLLLRIALPGSRWLDIATSQLAGNAASRVIPGGAASGGVVQARMLVQSGHAPGTVGAVLSATGLLTTGVLLALPVLTVPAVLIGPPPARQLQLGLVVSLVIATVLVALGLALLTWDRFVRAIATVVGRAVHVVRPRIERATVARGLVAERDQVAAAFRGRWLRALASAAGNRMFDYAALVAALYGVGAQVRPSLVLVAYVGALALAMVPITPGGLGFVETGLTALLVLAGVNTDQAVVATLLYRLVSFWAPIPVGALAWAGWRIHPRRGAPAAEQHHESRDRSSGPGEVCSRNGGQSAANGPTGEVDMPLSRRLAAEFVGTFWLVLGGCGAAVLAAGFPRVGIGLLGVSLAFGLTVLTMAYALGHISGGHFNPAVTFGLTLARRFDRRDVAPYVVTQVVAAIAASSVLYVIANGKPLFSVDRSGFAANGYGAHSPGGYSLTAALVCEIVMTAGFLTVILGATDRRAPKGMGPLAIGLSLTLIHLISIPVTNTSVNPARSTGPALFVGGWALSQLWLFWVAPLVGAAVAGLGYQFLTGDSGAESVAEEGQETASAVVAAGDVPAARAEAGLPPARQSSAPRREAP